MQQIDEAKELLERAEKEAQCCTSSAYWKAVNTKLFDQALAKLRETPKPTELTKWLREVISYQRYEKGDKELQVKVREACDIIERQAADLEKKDKLLFAYESVRAPKK